MTTDPKKSLTSTSISELAKSDVDQLLQTGLADFSLRELLGLLISSAGAAERHVYLEKTTADKPNGFDDRALQVGTVPSIVVFHAPAAASSGRQVDHRLIAAVIAKKSSPCYWDYSDRAARSMRPKTRFRRWDCPALNRTSNVWPRA